MTHGLRWAQFCRIEADLVGGKAPGREEFIKMVDKKEGIVCLPVLPSKPTQ